MGNIDWVSTDKKTRLSWHGPLGRSIPPMIRQTYLNDYFAPGYGDHDQQSQYTLNCVGLLYQGYDGVPWHDYFSYYLVMPTRFTQAIYRNGRIVADVPPYPDDTWQVLGATVVTFSGKDSHNADLTQHYLVAVFSRKLTGDFRRDQNLDPPCRWMDHVFCYAPLPAPKQPVTAWTVFHTETLSDDPNVLPPMLPYTFSGSGLQFATLVPQVNLQEPFQWTDGDGYLHGDPGWLVLDEYLILRGTFAPTAEGVTLQTISRTPQHCTFGHDSGGDVTGDPWDLTWTSWSTAFHRSSAVVALDFRGEEEVTVSGTLAYDYASSTAQGRTDGVNNGWLDATTTSAFHLTIGSDTLAVAAVHITSDHTESMREDPEGILDDVWTRTETVNTAIQLPLFLDLRYGAIAYYGGTWR